MTRYFYLSMNRTVSQYRHIRLVINSKVVYFFFPYILSDTCHFSKYPLKCSQLDVRSFVFIEVYSTCKRRKDAKSQLVCSLWFGMFSSYKQSYSKWLSGYNYPAAIPHQIRETTTIWQFHSKVVCKVSRYRVRLFPGIEGTNQNRHWSHHRWHATNSLERTRLSCWCL